MFCCRTVVFLCGGKLVFYALSTSTFVMTRVASRAVTVLWTEEMFAESIHIRNTLGLFLYFNVLSSTPGYLMSNHALHLYGNKSPNPK